jgi:hypothetical protein
MSALIKLAMASFEMEKQAGLLSIAKGVGSVAMNAVKQNPMAAKAALGGAVAGAAVSKLTQTKQAEEKEPFRASVQRGIGAAAGAIGGARAGDFLGKVTRKAFPKVGRIADEVGGFVGLAAGARFGNQSIKDFQKKAAEMATKALAKEEKDDVSNGKFNASAGGIGKSSLIDTAKKEMAKSAARRSIQPEVGQRRFANPAERGFRVEHSRPLGQDMGHKDFVAKHMSEASRAVRMSEANKLVSKKVAAKAGIKGAVAGAVGTAAVVG